MENANDTIVPMPEGIPDSCRLCGGTCCTEVHGKLMWKTPDIKRWIALFKGVHFKGDVMIVNTPCSKLSKNGVCTYHSERPQVCRRFEVGNRNCVEIVKRRLEPEHAAKVLEAIERKRKVDPNVANPLPGEATES